MNKLYGFLRKKELAPFLMIVCLVSLVASVWLCIINYKTTYAVLLGRLPQDASIALTIFVQGFEFLIPILALLGIIQALELSKELKLGLYIAWAAVMLIDFATAYIYLLGEKPMLQWSDYVIAFAVSLLFLFGELFVVLSGAGLVVSFIFWRTGSIPQWSALTPSTPVNTETRRSTTAEPTKMLRESHTGDRQLWRFKDGHQDWLPKDDPRLHLVQQTIN